MPDLTWSAVLLAAGRGRRAGQPKAWLPWRGRSLLDHQLTFLATHDVPVLVTVQAAWEERVAAVAPDAGAVAVNPDAPMLTSLQAALARAGGDWVSVHHVDMPVWVPSVWETVLAAAAPEWEAVIPTRGDRGGHPVLLSRAIIADILALDPATGRLDVFLRGRRVRRIPVDDDCVLTNWNQGVPD